MSVTIHDLDRQRTIIDHLEIAESLHERGRGLLGHRPLELGEGMLIRPCRWIHTFGMSFPIDVIYVSRDWRIVAVSESLRPRRIDRPVLRAWFVVEMAAGAIRYTGIAVGDRLELRPRPTDSEMPPSVSDRESDGTQEGTACAASAD